MSETTAIEGYGVPTKGLYEVEEKGYKTFGSTGQGENTEGVKDISDSVVSDRAMFVTIRAKAELGADSIQLRTGNYEFLAEYVWEKAATTLTLSSVLGLACASML